MKTIGVYLESCSVFQFKVLPVDGTETPRSPLSAGNWPLSENSVVQKLRNRFDETSDSIIKIIQILGISYNTNITTKIINQLISKQNLICYVLEMNNICVFFWSMK